MADDRISSPASPEPPPETPPRRRVYESTLFPKRKRRRFSPWVVIPLILLVCVGIFGYIQYAAHRVRFVDTDGQVVFASDQGTPGVSHLWIAHADGAGARRLTSGAASDTAPAFAPNGSQIAFLSDRESRQNQIFVVDADGQNLMQATRNAGAKSQPAWAPGAAGLLGYTAGGALSALSISSTGPGDVSRLLPPVSQHTSGADEQLSSQAATITVPTYAWSPAKDAGLAAVEDTGSFQALAVFPSLAAGPRDVQSLPQGGAQSGVPLAAADTLTLGWSPDGSLLAVAMLGIKGLPTPASGILLFSKDGDPAGGRPPMLVRSATDGPQNPVFSPDGTQILFEAWKPAGPGPPPVPGAVPGPDRRHRPTPARLQGDGVRGPVRARRLRPLFPGGAARRRPRPLPHRP